MSWSSRADSHTMAPLYHAPKVVGISWLVPEAVRPPGAQDVKHTLRALLGTPIEWVDGEAAGGPTLYLFAKDGREIPDGVFRQKVPAKGSVVLKLESADATSYPMIPMTRTFDTADRNAPILVYEAASYNPGESRLNQIASSEVLAKVAEELCKGL